MAFSLDTKGSEAGSRYADKAAGSDRESLDSVSVRLRSYQQEMLEASLQRNVIVTMDTGSGKTHVAIFRILAELERCDPDKLVWFMTPSVQLSEQQYRELEAHLPGYLVKTLLGRDGVDKWTDQRLWDAVLTNVRVVVGTPAVLEQALSHGFVRISRLALLVFDEAHRCMKKGPMNVIMSQFYHPAKRDGQPVPHILGLTASPVMGTNPADLRSIEANLDAQAITPKRHRSEFEQYVHPPEVMCVTVSRSAPDLEHPPALHCALNRVLASYDPSYDPHTTKFERWSNGIPGRAFEDLTLQPKPWWLKQVKALAQRSSALLDQLGPSAAEWHSRCCIERFLENASSETIVLPDDSEHERHHLAAVFKSILHEAQGTPDIQLNESSRISEKTHALIDTLVQHASPSLRCIIFAEQRAVVHGLAYMLRQHPEVDSNYSIGTSVGVSNVHGTLGVADLGAPKEQNQHLADFRNGVKNLMIATNVLEEGIDVTACNLVICFDPPSNLISFVQRRGRARQKNSKYIIFLDASDIKSNPGKWQDLETKMKEAYMNELRTFTPAEDDDEDTMDSLKYLVNSTGALLTLENAKAHLYHFCAVTLSRINDLIDLRPKFTTTNTGGITPYTCHVQLPSIVHSDLRAALSACAWRSEATAVKDAAFQAYVALHKAGLVNDNLLPLIKDYGPDKDQTHLDQPSIIKASQRLSSWKMLFEHTDYDRIIWHPATLKVTLYGMNVASVLIWLPKALPTKSSFRLYWNENLTYMVDLEPVQDLLLSGDDESELPVMRWFTRLMLESIHGGRMTANGADDFPLFCHSPQARDLFERREVEDGQQPASILLGSTQHSSNHGLIRVHGQYGRPFTYVGLSPASLEDESDTEPEVIVTAFPKRRDFLHPVADHDERNAAYTAKRSFPVTHCTVDNLPSKYALLAAFIPSIMHRIDVALLVDALQYHILRGVDIRNDTLVYEAISSPSAREAKDYNRLEFLGDTILKFCAVLQVLAQHPHWPEGYLDQAKFHLVSNNFLTKAALDIGLDKYILTDAFTGSKWRPVYVHEVLVAKQDEPREISSKVLADVVEALIGAAFVDGGVSKALKCVQTFLPREEWYSHEDAINRLLGELGPSQKYDLRLLEQLTGHHFEKPTLLVEAVTHITFPHNKTGFSYDRLEFLGDAILDLIIVPKLFSHHRTLKHWELHRVRDALVNGHFLGFCCMSYFIEEERYDIVERPEKESQLEVQESKRRVHLHDFLRADGRTMKARRQSIERFEQLRSTVNEGLRRGSKYPWPDLIAMRPQKFISDLVESVLAALFLDTRGDLSVCEAFIEKLGIFGHMHRILDHRIQTANPKEELGILAGQKTVTYALSKREEADGTKLFDCIARVGDVDVATATDCNSKEEAEIRAASEASRILEDKPMATGSVRKRKLDTFARDDDEHGTGLPGENQGNLRNKSNSFG